MPTKEHFSGDPILLLSCLFPYPHAGTVSSESREAERSLFAKLQRARVCKNFGLDQKISGDHTNRAFRHFRQLIRQQYDFLV